MENIYMPFKSKILNIKKHTETDYTFRMEFVGAVKPGQFFEVSIPKFGESPISVSEIGDGYVDLTIRRVGVVTDVIHSFFVGGTLYLRGPYGNGFDVNIYKGKEIIVAAGGTGLAPVKGIVDYFAKHPKECKDFNVMAGFKSPADILFKDNFKMWEKSINVTLTVDSANDDYTGIVGLITKYIDGIPVDNMDEVQVIVVGPPMMLKFTVAGFIKKGVKEKNIWVSYERKMCCGVGKCGHCKMDDTYICLEGPVFNYLDAVHLVD
ncbi:anaerobic sulfite reductase subunit AsrB [Clostridium estertheticum]|uniref:anaerobic sulfite reductase subunit AsrB n=1 Tax=Clostridium estertheticum TaxID=238834 RepID=UPI001C7DFE2C|nr:anaerobic sulfite reductase subunit AsrB [Clostridium estertheticum]MBX4258567.1 anaerobic sulfite reductase subunit AsrB [Clostridium estertheticum]WLC69955.1 anaerobic sulfite reductase subunit AsrB [Clostridium estertheticum]